MKSINLAAIDLNLLVAFEAIFEARSVTAAAQQLNLGQPALSAALGRLRVLFDDELFIRFGREMKPTARALQIAPEIAIALRQIRQTLESGQTFDPAVSQYTFVIGSSDYASAVIMPRLLRYCQQFAPGVDIRLISFEKDAVAALLEQHTIAIALGTFQTLPRQTQQIALMQEHFVGVCRHGHPALIQGSMSLTGFAHSPQALFTLRRDEVGVIDQALAKHNRQRRIVLTTPYLLTLPAIVASSDTIAAIPFRLAQPFIEQGLIAQFELPLNINPWAIAMMWSQLTDQSPPCCWLRQTIQQICRDI